MNTMRRLLAKYGNPAAKTLDVGSYDLATAENWGFSGCLRELFTGEYVGLDIQPGPNVDLVVKDPEVWREVPDNSFDQVVSVCCLEHCRAPWQVINECYRVLKPDGLTIHIAPWRWREHRYPEDCWRILPDGMRYLLGEWAGFEVLEVARACREETGELVYGVGRKPET